MKNLTPSWTRITEKRGDNLKKAELNALAVRARDGNEETLLDLWNAVKGFVKKKAVYYAKNHTAGMTTAEDLVQAGFFAVYDTVQAFDETREKTFLTLLKYFLQKRFAEEAGVCTSRRTVRRTAPTKQVQGMQSGISEDTPQPQRRIKT